MLLGGFSFVVEHDKVMEDENISAADAMPSNNIFKGVIFCKQEKKASKGHSSEFELGS